MDSHKFIIAEFYDGLQLIPAAWYNADKLCSIWPSHFKTKLRINKAIMTKEMPRDKGDWKELPIKKVFGIANTYEEGLEKLVRAEETSNVDDTALSSNEYKEREKKKRRLNARKHFSSSSEEDSFDIENQENYTQQDKIMPTLPEKERFMLNKKHSMGTPIQNMKSMLRENNSINVQNSNNPHIDFDSRKSPGNVLGMSSGRINVSNMSSEHIVDVLTPLRSENVYNNNNVVTNNITRNIERSGANIDDPNLDIHGFMKHIIWKTNKILYKLDAMTTVLNILYEKGQSFNDLSNFKEIDVLFPICTMSDLISVEEKLKELTFADNVLNLFKIVGGSTVYIMLRNIFKKAITNNVAKEFSWTGRNSKQTFKDLRLSTIIMQTVRMRYKEITDSDIANYASKWLAQASIRIQRDKKGHAGDSGQQ